MAKAKTKIKDKPVESVETLRVTSPVEPVEPVESVEPVETLHVTSVHEKIEPVTPVENVKSEKVPGTKREKITDKAKFKAELKKNAEGIYEGLATNEVPVLFHKNVKHNGVDYEAGKTYTFEASEIAIIKNNNTFEVTK